MNEVIRKIGKTKWRVYSKSGKNLGTSNSLAAAKKRKREIEFFKRKGEALQITSAMVDRARKTVEAWSASTTKPEFITEMQHRELRLPRKVTNEQCVQLVADARALLVGTMTHRIAEGENPDAVVSTMLTEAKVKHAVDKFDYDELRRLDKDDTEVVVKEFRNLKKLYYSPANRADDPEQMVGKPDGERRGASYWTFGGKKVFALNTIYVSDQKKALKDFLRNLDA